MYWQAAEWRHGQLQTAPALIGEAVARCHIRNWPLHFGIGLTVSPYIPETGTWPLWGPSRWDRQGHGHVPCPIHMCGLGQLQFTNRPWRWPRLSAATAGPDLPGGRAKIPRAFEKRDAAALTALGV